MGIVATEDGTISGWYPAIPEVGLAVDREYGLNCRAIATYIVMSK